MHRRFFLTTGAAALAAVALPRASRADDGGHVRDILTTELRSGRPCAAQSAAIRGTLARMARSRPPLDGRCIVVDLPSQTLTAYEGGTPSLDSVVVVGDPGWQTPDLDTTVAYVRFNPTWTVPQSIVEARDWRGKLRRSPGYFSRLGFRVTVGGRSVTPEEAAGSAERATLFVQQPGGANALGKVKFGLNAGQSVYLHDTNDKDGFEEDQRALSHGCMRVERALDLAGWALGMDAAEVRRLVGDDDRRERRPSPSIRMLTTYFTAWPDKEGRVAYYDDVYGRDGTGSLGTGGCAATADASATVDASVATDHGREGAGNVPVDYLEAR